MVGATTFVWRNYSCFFQFFNQFIFKKVMLKSKFIKELVQDKPEVLIHNGKIEFKTLARLGITLKNLKKPCEHGIEYYKDVKLAMFEIDGNISIISGNEN